jgi:hypothetical protein
MQKIRATSKKLLIYYQSPPIDKPKKRGEKGRKITEDNRTKGVLSQKARTRMKNCIDKLIESHTIGACNNRAELLRRKPVLTFVTVTLPSKQIHSDIKIKRYSFIPFLQILQEKYKVTAYVWRAEKQKNGNIHFHIIINRIIKWQAIRKEWNRCIERLGYVTEYQKRMKKLTLDEYITLREAKTEQQIRNAKRAYLKGKKEDFTNPNSTDIHAIRKIKNLSAYVSKYMTKTEKEEDGKIEGHLWGRSDNLFEIQHYETIPEDKDIKELKKLKETNQAIHLKEEYFEIFILKNINILQTNLTFKSEYIHHQRQNYLKLNEKPPSRQNARVA